MIAETEEIFEGADGSRLAIYVVTPARQRRPAPAIVFLHGGAWVSGGAGAARRNLPKCRYLAQRGMVAAAADYRILGKGADSIDDMVADARCAIRWLRARSDVDPDRVAVGGHSAGGQLALTLALLPEAGARPDAVVVTAPAIHLKGSARHLSPYELVGPGAPPTLILHGSRDSMAPSGTSRRFGERMVDAGNDCRVEIFERGAHGMFGYRRQTWEGFKAGLVSTDRFLSDIGFLRRVANVEDLVAAFDPPPEAKERRR